MAYAVAFFGVPWPDRVVKRRLFKWLMRGPITASTVLMITTVVRRWGEARFNARGRRLQGFHGGPGRRGPSRRCSGRRAGGWAQIAPVPQEDDTDDPVPVVEEEAVIQGGKDPLQALFKGEVFELDRDPVLHDRLGAPDPDLALGLDVIQHVYDERILQVG